MKRIVSTLLIFILCFALISCGNKDKDNSEVVDTTTESVETEDNSSESGEDETETDTTTENVDEKDTSSESGENETETDTTTENADEKDTSSESGEDGIATDTEKEDSTTDNVGEGNKPSEDNNKEDSSTENVEGTVKPENFKKQDYVLAEYYENFKTHGRTSKTVYGLECDASASGLEFSAYMVGDLEISLYVDKECYFTLYIDGERCAERIKAVPGNQTIKLASFTEGAVRNIRFLKQTETQQALSLITEVSFAGEFAKTPGNKGLLIEFIGDSITSGYGNLCANGASNPGSALNQDATQSYGFLAAEALGADASLVSYSGIGIAKGWVNFTMDKYFAADSYVRDTSKKFVPERIPDVVVINLGTNDMMMNASGAELAESVPKLINLIRTTYGKEIPIVWVHGMMGEGSWSYISDIIESEYQGEKGGIYSLQIAKNTQGGAGHPNLQAQRNAAETLAEFIKEKGLN